jgi:hypothetical protein
LESTGIKAEERAPSADSFLRLFGMENVKLITSPTPPAPKSADITAIRIKPKIRESKVKNITVTVDLAVLVLDIHPAFPVEEDELYF